MKERALRKAELKGDLADDLAFDNLLLARRVAELERRLERAAAGGGLASLIGLAPAPADDAALAEELRWKAEENEQRTLRNLCAQALAKFGPYLNTLAPSAADRRLLHRTC